MVEAKALESSSSAYKSHRDSFQPFTIAPVRHRLGAMRRSVSAVRGRKRVFTAVQHSRSATTHKDKRHFTKAMLPASLAGPKRQLAFESEV
jgi:hypothetical protein